MNAALQDMVDTVLKKKRRSKKRKLSAPKKQMNEKDHTPNAIRQLLSSNPGKWFRVVDMAKALGVSRQLICLHLPKVKDVEVKKEGRYVLYRKGD